MALDSERRSRYNLSRHSLWEKAKFIRKYAKFGGRVLIEGSDDSLKLKNVVSKNFFENFAAFDDRFFVVTNFGNESTHGATSPSIDNRAESLARIIVAHSQPDVVGYVVRGVVKPASLENSRNGLSASISSLARKIEESSAEVKTRRLVAFPDIQPITSLNGLSELLIEELIRITDDYASKKLKLGIVAVTAPMSVGNTFEEENPNIGQIATLNFDSNGNENLRTIT